MSCFLSHSVVVVNINGMFSKSLMFVLPSLIYQTIVKLSMLY